MDLFSKESSIKWIFINGKYVNENNIVKKLSNKFSILLVKFDNNLQSNDFFIIKNTLQYDIIYINKFFVEKLIDKTIDNSNLKVFLKSQNKLLVNVITFIITLVEINNLDYDRIIFSPCLNLSIIDFLKIPNLIQIIKELLDGSKIYLLVYELLNEILDLNYDLFNQLQNLFDKLRNDEYSFHFESVKQDIEISNIFDNELQINKFINKCDKNDLKKLEKIITLSKKNLKERNIDKIIDEVLEEFSKNIQ